jgi:hypothetical protein
MTERIKCAAIRLSTGDIVEGDNHRDIRAIIQEASGYRPVNGTHGFVTESGRFVNRTIAASIAIASGQAKEIADPKLGLSSSDLR